MQKSSNAGISKLNPRNFVKRVLSRRTNSRSASKSSLRETTDADPANEASTSSSSSKGKTTNVQTNAMENADDKSKSSVKFQSELTLLKTQIETLQISVNQMHNDNEKKEQALVALAKEKEQLSINLKKQKRSNVNLKQQLEDERNFYYKEKEQYCNEMHNFKKMKQKEPGSVTAGRDDNNDEANTNDIKEISHLKNTLNQTLDANYNLSVKFLRMKNTKLSLKKQLGELKEKHEGSISYYKEKMNEFQRQLDGLLQEQLHKPIPPSSKKYLHLLKHNGTLIHENLQLQFDIDRLHMEIERFKLIEVKNETNSKLKLIHHNNNDDNNFNSRPCNESHHGNAKNNNHKMSSPALSKCLKCKLTKADSVRTNGTSITTESKSQKSRSSQTPATTQRSRNSVQVLYEKNHSHRNHHRSGINRHHGIEEKAPSIKKETIKNNETKVSVGVAADESLQHGVNNDSSKYDLMTISNSNIMPTVNKNDGTLYNCAELKSCESKSAPEIVLRSAGSDDKM